MLIPISRNIYFLATNNGRTYAQRLAETQFRAIKGRTDAAREIANRFEGPAEKPQQVEVVHGSDPLKVSQSGQIPTFSYLFLRLPPGHSRAGASAFWSECAETRSDCSSSAFIHRLFAPKISWNVLCSPRVRGKCASNGSSISRNGPSPRIWGIVTFYPPFPSPNELHRKL
jgi:hypothetical protein